MKTTQSWVLLLVALCAYNVYSAAIPDDESGDEEKTLQARPAPVGHAGVKGKVGPRAPQRRNATAKAAPARAARKGQKKGQKNGAAMKQAGKGKLQAGKANMNKAGKIKQNAQNGKAPNQNKKGQKNKLGKNPIKTQSGKTSDRQVKNFNKPAGAEYDALEPEESVDYGAPQKPPGPTNRLAKFPGAEPAHQSGDAALPPPPGAEPGWNSLPSRRMRPLPMQIDAAGMPVDADGSSHHKNIQGPMVMRPPVMPPYYGPDGDRSDMPVKEIMPIPADDGMMRPAVMPPHYRSEGDPPEMPVRSDDGMMRPAVMPADYVPDSSVSSDGGMAEPAVVMDGPGFAPGPMVGDVMPPEGGVASVRAVAYADKVDPSMGAPVMSAVMPYDGGVPGSTSDTQVQAHAGIMALPAKVEAV